MSRPIIGALFAGYGGLELGVQQVIDADLSWYSEINKGALKILEHRHPDVPNIGDITTVDWSTVPRVDILTGGSPCQDLSHAGKRAGMTEGTRSNLWVAMREAIAQLKPSLVIWENVRGAYSACADSDLGRCPRCVDPSRPGGHAPVLRALGRVLGDLSDLGYDAQWHGLRAADIGAPHGRFRVFVLAENTQREGRGAEGNTTPREASSGWAPAVASGSGGVAADEAMTLLPTPTTQDSANLGAPSQHNRNSLPLNTLVTLLPTPAVNDMGEGKTVDAWDEWTERMQAKHGNGNGHGKSLSIEAQRLLPTLRVKNNENRQSEEYCGEDGNFYGLLHNPDRWGDYADAIRRWENLTRPAPEPTQLSSKGNPQLSARFSEWMMGVPEGWVTDVPGITRNEALKALGNGVVPQQAAAALRLMLTVLEAIA